VNVNSTESLATESLLPPAPTDRRPAIWPWLVMPLVTLALFYGLDRMNRQQDQSAYHSAAQSAADSSDDSEGR
jgi:hypothetical protein